MNLHNGAMTGNRQFLIFINYTTKYSPPTQSRRFSQTQRDWFVEASKISSTVIWQRGKASFKWNQIVNIRRGEVQKSEQSLNSREVFSFTLWHLNDLGNHICDASFCHFSAPRVNGRRKNILERFWRGCVKTAWRFDYMCLAGKLTKLIFSLR